MLVFPFLHFVNAALIWRLLYIPFTELSTDTTESEERRLLHVTSSPGMPDSYGS